MLKYPVDNTHKLIPWQDCSSHRGRVVRTEENPSMSMDDRTIRAESWFPSCSSSIRKVPVYYTSNIFLQNVSMAYVTDLEGFNLH
jgi:hypothetical protein